MLLIEKPQLTAIVLQIRMLYFKFIKLFRIFAIINMLRRYFLWPPLTTQRSDHCVSGFMLIIISFHFFVILLIICLSIYIFILPLQMRARSNVTTGSIRLKFSTNKGNTVS